VVLVGFNLNVQTVSSLAWRTEGIDSWSVLHGREVPWPAELDHMNRISVSTYGGPRFRQEIATLRDLLGTPLVVVDHIPALAKGKVIPDRVRLNELLARVCEREGVTFLPTTSLMDGFTLDEAADDANHWAKSFEPVAGVRLADAVDAEARTAVGAANR